MQELKHLFPSLGKEMKDVKESKYRIVEEN